MVALFYDKSDSLERVKYFVGVSIYIYIQIQIKFIIYLDKSMQVRESINVRHLSWMYTIIDNGMFFMDAEI